MMTALLAGCLLLTGLGGCQPDDGREVVGRVEVTLPVQAPVAPEDRAKNVLLVINNASSESREIGAYYRAKRKIPRENVVLLSVSTTENVGMDEFRNGILTPVRNAIRKSPNRIDFIVTTTGVPLRLENDNGHSVDGHLMAMDLPLEPIRELTPAEIRRVMNPYFGKAESFDSRKYRMYLTTRLTGYTVEDAKRLVDNSLAAKPEKGPFFFDKAENRKTGGYLQMQNLLDRAHENLIKLGFDSMLDDTAEFRAPAMPLMGYASWGSNDGAFNGEAYRRLRFKPGALVETYVSTSGRTFRKTEGGQSLIVDLIAQGVTGVKGYVSEPYTFALAQPDILFDRYVGGFNLAESFYMASPVIKWKDVVIGDPLCQPYPMRVPSPGRVNGLRAFNDIY